MPKEPRDEKQPESQVEHARDGSSADASRHNDDNGHASDEPISDERPLRPNRTGGQAEGEPDVPEGGDTEKPLERKRPSQAEG